MADGGNSGWSGPTVLVDGQSLPLISIKPSASQGAPGYNAGVNASGADDIASKVTAAANQHGVDPDFALKIAHAESSLNPDATSPKGAHGVMQLMPDTAKGLGVDPHNVDQNIDGGVRYLKQLSDKYGGNKSLIAAAYNAGPGAVDQHGGVPPYPETQAYVNKVVGNQGRPAGDADWDKGEVINNTPSVGTSVAPIRNQAAPDWEQGKPINAGVPLDNAGVTEAPKSPGYQKALAQAQQNPNALATGLANAFNPETALSQNKPEVRPFNSALNGFINNSLPVIQGGANAIGQALTNLFNNKSGISAKEAFQAGRDASQQDLSSFGQRHPVLNTASNLGGQVVQSALIPEAKGVGLGARLLAGAAKVGGQSALTGAGGAASEGQSPADIAKSAAVQGAIGTALSPVGEAGELGAQAFKSAGGKAAARLLAPSIIGAGIGGQTAYQLTHDPVDAAKGAVAGSALFGAPGLSKSKAAQKMLSTLIPNSGEKTAALMKLAETMGFETPEAAADYLESKAGKSVIEAVNKEHQQPLMQTAGELNPNNLQHAQQVIEARQSPSAIKERVQAGVANATNINPAEAERSWEDASTNRRQTVSAPLWKKVDTLAPVDTPEHSELLANEPVVRQALGKAAFDLGPEGTVPNPKYKPPVPGKTANTLTPEDIQEVASDARGSGHVIGEDVRAGEREAPKNVPSINDPQGMAEYLNAKHGYGQAGNGEPEHVYSQKAWVQAERVMRKMVPRYEQGPHMGQVNYENPRTFEVQQSQRSVNNANKKHFEGLEEAKISSGEDAASESANEAAYNFNPKNLHGESAEKFIERYDDMNEMQKDATKHGYLQRFYQKFRENPTSTIEEYLNSDQHQKVMKAMFGDKAEAFNNTLQKELDLAKHGKEIAEFKPTPQSEKQPLGTTLSGAFGAISQIGAGPLGVIKGGITGAALAKNYQVVEHAMHLARQGDMTPAARQYLAEKLGSPAEQVAAELKEAAAAKRNMKASQSQIAKRVGHGAALVGANAIGPPITHALSNVNSN